jgi:hypothetical protein
MPRKSQSDRSKLAQVKTKKPFQVILSPQNWMYLRSAGEELAGAYTFLIDEALPQTKSSVLVFSGGGQHPAVLPFDYGYRGAVGTPDQPLGWGGTGLKECDAYTRYPADLLPQRVAQIASVVGDIQNAHATHDVRMMPYVDLGTHFYGRHDRPQPVDNIWFDAKGKACCSAPRVNDAWGFWEFYDHWNEYAKLFPDLGVKPPDPTQWLACWWNADFPEYPEFGARLAAYAFHYYPRKDIYGQHYRYTLCRNSDGFKQWWGTLIQQVAKVGYKGAHIDNAVEVTCWCERCNEGFAAWLQGQFNTEEQRRYCAVLTNGEQDILRSKFYNETTEKKLPPPRQSRGGFDEPWSGRRNRDETLIWRPVDWYVLPKSQSGGDPAPNALFPDAEAYRGKLCARVDADAAGQEVTLSALARRRRGWHPSVRGVGCGGSAARSPKPPSALAR